MQIKAPLMLSVVLGLGLSQVFAAAETTAPASKASAAALPVAQIVDRHVAARGGLQAWHAVQTLSVSGKLDAGTGDSLARSEKLARAGRGASARRPPDKTAAEAGKANAEHKAFKSHLLTKKSKSRKRHLRIHGLVHPSNLKLVKRMMGLC